MRRPRTLQEFFHWAELGGGARWIRLAAVVAGVFALSLVVAWKQFRGPVSEITLLQADSGRQLATGQGFTTLVNYPQTAATLARRGVRFDLLRPYPELHHAPLYSLVIGGALRLLPEGKRARLFSSPPVPPDGFAADYFLLGLNLVLLWLAAWQTYRLGRKLFDPQVGWLAALALLLSVAIWRETVALNGVPLLMVLALGAFQLWTEIECRADSAAGAAAAAGRLLALGALGGLLFLAEYSAGALTLVALGYAFLRFRGRPRIVAVLSVALGFAVVSGPWVARNVALTGNPVALAVQDIALKAGDPTAEPATVRAAYSAVPPELDLRKLANKTLTSLQENGRVKFWSAGATWLAAFFVAGWLYGFRSSLANRLRWIFTLGLAVLLVAQAALNSGETERPVLVWLAPLVLIFGAAFFYVLVGSNVTLARWPGVAAAGLLALQALPLMRDAVEPRRVHFHYPPYFPALFQGVRQDLERRGANGRYGLMTDVPAGFAWYAQARVWAQPGRLRDFHAIAVEQPIGELLLSPQVLDRPYFSELGARLVARAGADAVPSRFGEWGEVYAGLLGGRMPADFPLGPPLRLADNVFVLQNPALPALRGK
ncbi:MAG: hypothetical protein ABIQ12_14180 [Opitutaceae bacterium]